MTDTWREVILSQFTRSVQNGKVPKIQQRIQITGTGSSPGIEQDYSYEQAAKRLGAIGRSIRNWVQKFRQTGELPAKSETQPKADELRQLRKENARLKMENDILKKRRRTLR
jgi:transposase-like protein